MSPVVGVVLIIGITVMMTMALLAWIPAWCPPPGCVNYWETEGSYSYNDTPKPWPSYWQNDTYYNTQYECYSSSTVPMYDCHPVCQSANDTSEANAPQGGTVHPAPNVPYCGGGMPHASQSGAPQGGNTTVPKRASP